MAMSNNSKMILNYLKDNNGADLTAADVAEALGLDARQVNGAFTSAIQRKDLGMREEAEVELADGSHKKVKFLRLNDVGMAFDPDAVEEPAE